MRGKSLPLGLMLALVLAVATATASAAELAGVRLSDTLTVGRTPLELNGIGLRTKYYFRIYVGGLYLARPSTDPAAIIAADAPKALVMQFVRDINRSKLVEAYREAFAANAPALMSQQKASVDRFLAFLPDVKNGERLSFTYQPGKGSTFRAGNSKTLLIPGKSFADLYLMVFIGPRPPTARFKKELLGTDRS
ncbi:MAG: chalcone isomerase family protein [Acidiferrobacterales bacterium]